MDPRVAFDDDQDNGANNSGNRENSNGSSEVQRRHVVRKSRRDRIDFMDDPPEEWTYDRQLAMYLLKNYKEWYTQTPKFNQRDELNEAKEKTKKQQDGQSDGGEASSEADKNGSDVTDDDEVDDDEYRLIERRKKRSADEEDELQRALNAEAFAYPFTESHDDEPPSLEKAWACKLLILFVC